MSRSLPRVGAAALLAYTVVLVLAPNEGYERWRDAVLANVVLAAPGIACLVRATRGGPQRAAALLLGLGMLSFAAGNVVYVAQVEPPVPSPADTGYLASPARARS